MVHGYRSSLILLRISILNYYVDYYLLRILILCLNFQQEEKQKEDGEEDDPLDETALDWWSKYFASLDTVNEVKLMNI